MTDDSTAAGTLQPFELKPSENLLPRLGPWQPFRFTFGDRGNTRPRFANFDWN